MNTWHGSCCEIAVQDKAIVSVTSSSEGNRLPLPRVVAAAIVIALAAILGAPHEAAAEPNAPPEFEGTSTTRQVDENSGAGTAVGAAVTATDANDTALTYSLSGADEFAIAAASGQISVAQGALLDFETTPSYTVTVNVSDGKDATGGPDAAADATISVTISVTDVNEPPTAPGAPSVAKPSQRPTTSLDVAWSAPDLSGQPAITDYDVRYRAKGSSAGWSGAAHDGTGTSTTLTSLTPGTTYEVQVLATNDEGSSPWSATGTGTTAEIAASNPAPAFDEGTAATRQVAENSTAGTTVGVAVTATDANDTALTYALSGADEFAIAAASGQISVARRAVLDYETKATYTVTVSVSDGKDAGGNPDAAADDTISVTINVSDVSEPPTAPEAPTVTQPNSDPEASLVVAWTAPDMSGKPAITDYDVRYRVKESTGWSSAAHDGSGTTTTLTSLTPGTIYEVQVLATNADDSSGWSAAGTGTTAEMTVSNPAPEFDEGAAATRAVPENSVAGTTVGVAVTASDANDTALTYSLSGAAAFSIGSASGQISVAQGAVLDFEAQASYAVTVSVSDAKNAIGAADGGATDASIAITINVTDENEPPAAPGAPSVTQPNSDPETSLEVAWSAPDTTGKPAITDYDVRYRVKESTGWSSATHDGTATSTTLSGLTRNTTYQVQVLASNADGGSPWSGAGVAKTDDDGKSPTSKWIPAFDEGTSATRQVAEDSVAGTTVGVAVTASDFDNNALTYSLSGAAEFAVDAANGQIRVARGAVLDFEATTSSYTVTVGVSDGKGLDGSDASEDDTISVTISVTDVDEPPAAPGAPSVTPPNSDPETSLEVAWSAPDMTRKPAITDYDVQYRVPGSPWSSAAHDGTGTTTTLTDLAPGTTYEVQVLATNDEGGSKWSAAGTGTTAALVVYSEPAPEFVAGTSTTREVAENSNAGTTVGAAVTATDANDAALTYSLSGADEFTIAATSGQISVARGAVLDFEATTNSYTVTVSVSDGKDATGMSDAAVDATISVTIDVTDEPEPPAAPDAPKVKEPVSDPETSRVVTWTPPDTAGPPITDYDVRYRAQGNKGWSSFAHNGTATTATLTGLIAATTYEVRVLATSDEGSSPWSAAGTGATAGSGQQRVPNSEPEFDATSPTREVAENSVAGTTVGAAVAAADADADALTYSLSGADEFTIAAASGRISVARRAVLDYEAKASYTVTVSVSDGTDADGNPDASADATISVKIGVTDVDEPPPAPAVPRLSKPARNPETALAVAWSPPGMSGKPAITDYAVRYRVHGHPGWTSAVHSGTGTATTLTGLIAGTTYEVQVQAANVDGSSPWSATAIATVNDFEPAPVFDEGTSATRQVAENSAAGIAVGAAVTATDANDAALTYDLTGAAAFTIAAASGQISVARGAVLDFEATPSYTVTVSVRDGKDAIGNPDAAADASIAITIEVTDVNEPPPALLAAPTVTKPFTAPDTSLEITWTAPDMIGRPPVIDYDVEYRESDASTWTPHPFAGTGLTTTLTGLRENTRYEVRVRANNDEGTGPWSSSTATPPTVRVTGPAEIQTGLFAVYFRVMPEQVEDFESADIQVTNGRVTTFEHLGQGTYAAQITPGGSGTVSVQVPAGRFHGADRTPNQKSNLYLVEVDDAVPSVPGQVAFALEENQAGPIVLGAVSDGAAAALGWTYAIASGAAGKFAIEPATGRLSYVGQGEDYETPPSSYTLTVATTSASGRTASTVVTVHVVDVNEPPEPVGTMASWVMHSGTSITFNSEPYFVDPDGDSLHYEADSSDPVVATAKTSSPPVTITAQASGRTRVTVRTCDPAGACAEQQVGVLVVEEDITFRPEELEVKEGAEETYTVNLLSEPPGQVTITLTSVDPKAATVSPAQLIFHPHDWNTPQLVTVAGVPDDDHADETVTVIHSASGPGYKGSAEFTVTVLDDDETGVTFTPAAVRIDDGTTIRGYAVVLDTMPTGAVTIGPENDATGTLRVTPERLTFTPDNWDEPQHVTLVSSEVLEDKTVRIRHRVSGANYEEVAAAAVTVTVVDDERAQRSRLAEHWLARFGRTVAGAAVDTVRGRFAATSGESYLTLNGQRLGALPGAAAGATPAAVSVAGPDPSLQQVAASSAFQQHLSVAQDEAAGFRPGLALWGHGAITHFEGQPTDDQALNGDVLAGHLGADYRFSRQWQAGVAVSYTGGTGDVADREASSAADVTSWLVSGYPYVRFSPLDELAVWLALGLGYGEMELDDAPRPVRPEIAMYLAAAGIDSTLLSLQHFELALSADAFAVRMESSDSAPALPALSVDVQSVRLLLEGRAELGLTAVSRFEPSLELGARYDHGDTENGIGGEVGGGLAYVNTALGLNVEARGRYLITHEDSAFHQWGASLIVSLAPGRGEGLSLSLVPAWGVAASGVDALLHDAGHLAASGAGAQLRGLQPEQMDLAVGYGLKVGDRGLLTPFGELGLAREATRARLGLRLGGADSSATAPLEVYVGRDATTQDTAGPTHYFGLNASIRA